MRSQVATTLCAIVAITLGGFALSPARADQAQIDRGKYLVTISGCSDCHTPGTFLGNPDMKRYLGGSDVGFAIPGLGIFPGRNLTPDNETGLGKWSAADIIKAITTGGRPDGRQLAPIMPYEAFSKLTKSDAEAIAAFLKSIPAVSNKVAGPFGPSDKSTIFVMAVVPPDVFNGMPKPPAGK